MTPDETARLTQTFRRAQTAGLGLAGLAALGWLFPRARLWGVHAPAFLHPAAAALLMLVAVLMLSPAGERVIQAIRKAHPRPVWWGIWIAVAVALFILLRVREPLLGDGQTLLKHLETIGRVDARGLTYVDKGQGRWAEPLETAVHETVFRIVAATFHPPVAPDAPPDPDDPSVLAERNWFFETGRWTYIILSALAGGVSCYLLGRFAKRMLPESRRMLFLLSVLGSGAVLIFFGYVEDYAWASVAVVGCILAAVEDAYRPQRWPWRTIAWWAAALAMHLMAIFLLPMIAYLLLNRWIPALRVESRAKRLIHGALLSLSVVVLLAAGLAPQTLRSWILPLIGTASRAGEYTLLSVRHFVDLANLLVLVVPLVPLAVSRGSWLGDRYPLRALQLACAGGIGFVLLFDPRLGAARDWDLYSVALWPLILSAAWIFAQQEWGQRQDAALACVIAGILLIPVPLVLVNAGTPSEVKRFEVLLGYDRGRSGIGWENLADYYRREHNDARVIETLQQGVSAEPNPRRTLKLANELRRMGRLEEAEPLYIEAAESKPEYIQSLIYLAQSYARHGDAQRARDVVRRMNRMEPGNPIYSRLLLQLDSLAGDSTAARN